MPRYWLTTGGATNQSPSNRKNVTQRLTCCYSLNARKVRIDTEGTDVPLNLGVDVSVLLLGHVQQVDGSEVEDGDQYGSLEQSEHLQFLLTQGLLILVTRPENIIRPRYYNFPIVFPPVTTECSIYLM